MVSIGHRQFPKAFPLFVVCTFDNPFTFPGARARARGRERFHRRFRAAMSISECKSRANAGVLKRARKEKPCRPDDQTDGITTYKS